MDEIQLMTPPNSSSGPIPAMDHPEHPPMDQMSCIFTDIIDSTKLWEHNAPKMWKALQLHDSIIRTEILKLSGYEVKTAGDCFHIVFQNAASALEFCLCAQRVLHTTDLWPPEIIASQEQFAEGDSEIKYNGMAVRMGIHFGRPYAARMNPITHRMDYYGPMVNTSARIQDEAEGGDIAVSDEFIKEVWRCQPSSLVGAISPLTNNKRTEILLNGKWPQFFELNFDRELCELRGVRERVYITRIRWRKTS